jgi:ABC-type lipoprotein export system ATPase subunit
VSLELKSIKKSYAAPDGSVSAILDVPEFEMADGEHVALIGSSGSGKTTLLHVIAGIVRQDSGQIVLRINKTPCDVSHFSEAQRDRFRGQHLGYVFQTHHLLPGFTALENVLLGMSFTGRSPDKAWAKHLLDSVGLSDRLHYVPAKLSVGQQQRVAVARALANRPQLVLADEPTGSLDQTNARQVMQLIRELATQAGSSVLIVTHDRDLAATMPRVVDLKQINLAAK